METLAVFGCSRKWQPPERPVHSERAASIGFRGFCSTGFLLVSPTSTREKWKLLKSHKKHLTFFNRNDHFFKISGSDLPSKMIISRSKSQKSPVLFRSSEHHTFPCAMPPAALRVALYQYLLVVQTKLENREKNEKLVCEDDLKWVVRMAHSSDTSKWNKRSMPNFYQILWGRILENQMENPDEKNLL